MQTVATKRQAKRRGYPKAPWRPSMVAFEAKVTYRGKPLGKKSLTKASRTESFRAHWLEVRTNRIMNRPASEAHALLETLGMPTEGRERLWSQPEGFGGSFDQFLAPYDIYLRAVSQVMAEYGHIPTGQQARFQEMHQEAIDRVLKMAYARPPTLRELEKGIPRFLPALNFTEKALLKSRDYLQARAFQLVCAHAHELKHNQVRTRESEYLQTPGMHIDANGTVSHAVFTEIQMGQPVKRVEYTPVDNAPIMTAGAVAGKGHKQWIHYGKVEAYDGPLLELEEDAWHAALLASRRAQRYAGRNLTEQAERARREARVYRERGHILRTANKELAAGISIDVDELVRQVAALNTEL